jgi:hypothetical protein
MRLDTGVVADIDLEVHGYYEAPRPGQDPDPRYLIFGARARNHSLQAVIDPMGNLVRRDRILGAWVDLPITLLTAEQIRDLELQAENAFAQIDA